MQWQVHSLPNNITIGSLTLNAPATLNALTVEMGQEFSAQCRQITESMATDNNNNLTAIVLTGRGKAFSAGGNLDWLMGLGDNNSVHANTDAMLQFYSSFLCVRDIPVPVVAALTGPAMGAGAGLALACDLRTAHGSNMMLLGLHFARLGLHAGMGVSHFLSSALGNQSGIINELLLTGKTLSAQECLALGLVNRVSDDAQKSAFALATEISQQHPVAVRTMLQTLRQRQDQGLQQALQREAYAQAVCYARGDWGEGIRAVAEKRDPRFDPYHAR